jgi:hypothetical protein
MRTSPQYLLTSYRKILTKQQVVKVKQEPTENIVKQEPSEDNDSRLHIQKVVEDPYKKQNEAIKKKYKENEQYRKEVLEQQKKYKSTLSAYDIRKRKIMSMLRNSAEYRKSIRQETLDTYGIILDDIVIKK